MNIYDFAGNEWEWTLEKTSFSDSPCVDMGGSYFYMSSDAPASYRANVMMSSAYGDIGFRSTFYSN